MYEKSGDLEKAMQLRNDIVVTEGLLAAKYSKKRTLAQRPAQDVEVQPPVKKRMSQKKDDENAAD
jgi:hypothetical protein